MKKTALLNSHMSHLISELGHTDEVTICDAGLPIPLHTPKIDLALHKGIPSFIQTVEAFLSESQIEGIILAEELPKVNPDIHNALLNLIKSEQSATNKEISINYISHDSFKSRTKQSKAIIRTGECSPYANIIFQSGVTF